MHLSLGFSPCPNDTFIFDALVNKKIDTGGLTFEVLLEDVETLNEWAIAGKLDISKLSYGVLPQVLDKYFVLQSGSALGRGVGPLLISNREEGTVNVEKETTAIPGENTTAHFLFMLAYPHAKNKVFLRYDEIEDYVSAGWGPGVIIHENRFTYTQKGLNKIIDLGDYWEKETGLHVPLGGIVMKREADEKLRIKVDYLIKQSIESAYTHYPELNDFIRFHSQEMSEDIMRKHIELYVNRFSFNLGVEGKDAIIKLLEVYISLHPGTSYNLNDIFSGPQVFG